MAITKKEEARALSSDERELVEKSHHPVLQELPDEELSKLVKLMRNRREKAKKQADQRRREIRGKSEPKGARDRRPMMGRNSRWLFSQWPCAALIMRPNAAAEWPRKPLSLKARRTPWR